MIVIADSGSTKTDWRYIDEYNNIHLANTIGMNPYFITAEQIVEELSQGSANLFPSQEILRVVFYGAGCDSPRNYVNHQRQACFLFVALIPSCMRIKPRTDYRFHKNSVCHQDCRKPWKNLLHQSSL